MIKIRVNGLDVSTESQSITDFIRSKGLDPDKCIIEVNAQIVKKELWQTTTLKEGDLVEIVKLVGGG